MGLEPILDEVLGVVTEAQHEVSLSLQMVDRLYGFMDLWGVELKQALWDQIQTPLLYFFLFEQFNGLSVIYT